LIECFGEGVRSRSLHGGQRVDVERDEELVEEVVGQDVVQVGDVQAEDVVQVVQVVQVLGYQVGQAVLRLVAAKEKM
jgi:hypothetical protein